jgi:hypothetical protein
MRATGLQTSLTTFAGHLVPHLAVDLGLNRDIFAALFPVL